MISAGALDELAEFAERGQLGYGIELWCSNLNPEAGSVVSVHWDFEKSGCQRGVLEVVDAGRIEVSPVGQQNVHVGGEPIQVQLSVDGETTENTIQPRFTKPHVQLRLPRRFVMGETSRLTWQSNAESCVLIVTDGESVQETEVGPSGGLDIQARNIGDLIVEIKAYGRHARFSPEGIASDEASAEVLPPPLRIDLDSDEQVAFVGDEVVFRWQVAGAESVRLIAVDRDEVFDVRLIGEVIVSTDCETERFRLVAIGFNGGEAIREFKVVPRILDLDHLSEALTKLTTQPWE